MGPTGRHRDAATADGPLVGRLRAAGVSAARRRFGVDARALAALRISLGVLILADLALRSRDLVAFYTDVGVLPRGVLFELYPASRYSLHAVSGTAWYQGLLFAVAGAVAVALLVGYRPRLAAAVSLLLLASLHARNPLVLTGGDTLLRRLLFWGVFLPLGERWSIGESGSVSRRTVTSVATAALLIQVVLVYTVTGLFKLRSPLWIGGRELQYLLQVDQLTVFLGDALGSFPLLLQALTWLWLAMVLSSGLLVVLTGWRRGLLVALFASMHLGMLLTMKIGLFPLISLASLLPFVPTRGWDLVERRLSGAARWLPDRLAIPGWLSSRGAVDFEAAHPSTPNRLAGTLPARRRVFAVVVGLLLASSLCWNAMSVGLVATPDRLAEVRDPTDHAWDMFAMGRRADGWLVAPSTLATGEQVDAFRGGPVSWDPPPELASTFPSARWLRYSLSLRPDGRLAGALAGYLCWRWNHRHGTELVNVSVVEMRRPVSVSGPGQFRRVPLADRSC